MQFAILFHETPTDFAHRDDDDHKDDYWASWNTYMSALREAGVEVTAGAALHGGDVATTVVSRGGDIEVQDGPYADTKEQLGGLIVVDVSSLDVALEWAKRAPCVGTGGCEVRPVLPTG